MNCNCCKKSNFQNLLDLGLQPYANKYPSKDLLDNEFKENLLISICLNCFTCNTNKIASRKEMFEEYFYLSSVNPELVNHFEELSKIIPNNSKLLDIGSNDGILLKPLKNKNVNAIGIDPSENVGKIANLNGLKTIIGFFDDEKSDVILREYGEFDYIVASSIFTHVEDSDKFVKNIYKILKNNGTFILEIEYIKNILTNLEFERFYFDRPYYFSIRGIKEIFEKNKLFINKIEEISPHGGSLRFYISKNPKDLDGSLTKSLTEESLYFKDLFKTNFQDLAFDAASNLKKELIKLRDNKKKVIAFGCPARFSTITNFVDIDKSLINFVIDDSPLKQDKFSPGQHIPIVNRNFLNYENADAIIVFAYEYFDSIFKFTNKFNIPHFKPIPFSRLN